jgi:hypothetical protein
MGEFDGVNMAKQAEDQATTEDDVVVVDDTTTEETGSDSTTVDGQTGEVVDPAVTETDDVVVTIGEEAPPAEEETPAPEWVRELRKNHRELVRENRELKEKLTTTSTAETKPAALGQKPKLEDHDYDTEKFEQELAKWYDRKRAHDDAVAQAEAAQKDQQKAWQAKLDNYGKAKAELKVKDMEDAEATATETLNVTQQGIILQGAENSALVIYALGKNPKKAKELAAITDPVKFAFAVAKLETQLKVTNRKAAPPPEKTVSGSAPKSGAVDSTLERLRAEAEKTGDFTKVTAYKRQKRQAA